MQSCALDSSCRNRPRHSIMRDVRTTQRRDDPYMMSGRCRLVVLMKDNLHSPSIDMRCRLRCTCLLIFTIAIKFRRFVCRPLNGARSAGYLRPFPPEPEGAGVSSAGVIPQPLKVAVRSCIGGVGQHSPTAISERTSMLNVEKGCPRVHSKKRICLFRFRVAVGRSRYFYCTIS